MTQAQRAWYEAMSDAGEMIQIRDKAGLESHLTLWLDETILQLNRSP